MNDKTIMRAGVEGWLLWELVTGSGLVLAAGEQHNLITNAGLDSISGGFSALQAYAALGTGTVPPSVTDTALVAEVARSQQAGPGDGGFVRVADLQYRRVRVVEFAESEGNGNLTEWGFSAGPAGTSIGVREVFRDGSGTPVVLTKTAATRLRLTYTLEVTLGGSIAATPSSLTIDGLGTFTGHTQILAVGELTVHDQLVRGLVGVDGNPGPRNALVAYDAGIRNGPVDRYTGDYSLGSGYGMGLVKGGPAPAYVPGSFTRPGRTYTFAAADAVGTIGGFALTIPGPTDNHLGWVQIFDAGIPKDDQHVLSIVGPAITWGRR